MGASEKVKCLVVGGAGFLGREIVRQLLEHKEYDVAVFDVRDAQIQGVLMHVGDIRDRAQVLHACKGIQVVIHCATAAPTAENALNNTLMHAVNVEGTKNVIEACCACSVSKLVYTSSASVVFEGKNLHLVNENVPYAKHPMDYYTKTKILGEVAVLDANGRQGLATCALRPSGIFGEGDPIFVPTVVKQAKLGKMKYIIGSGDNLMDFTYVGNVATAHLEAANALTLTSVVAGQAYFITNGEPVPFWTMMGDVCEGLGYERPRIKLPFALILLVAVFFEYIIRPVCRPFVELKSDFSVNRILIATTYRTFSIAKAKKDFNYEPRVSLSAALVRTLLSFKHLQSSNNKQ